MKMDIYGTIVVAFRILTTLSQKPSFPENLGKLSELRIEHLAFACPEPEPSFRNKCPTLRTMDEDLRLT
jgi:hypothetical protein